MRTQCGCITANPLPSPRARTDGSGNTTPASGTRAPASGGRNTSSGGSRRRAAEPGPPAAEAPAADAPVVTIPLAEYKDLLRRAAQADARAPAEVLGDQLTYLQLRVGAPPGVHSTPPLPR